MVKLIESNYQKRGRRGGGGGGGGEGGREKEREREGERDGFIVDLLPHYLCIQNAKALQWPQQLLSQLYIK